MDKKTMLKVFGDAFLRSMVVLMAILIVGFGVFFLVRVNTDKKQQAQEPVTEEGSTYSDEELEAMLAEENANDTEEASTEATTEEPTTEEVTEVQDIPSNDKNIVVLNGTSKSGLASGWSNKLTGAGFSNIAYGNYGGSSDAQTHIYVTQEGMGNDLASYFSDAVVSVGSIDAGDYSIKGGTSMDQVDIFIVIGSNDTNVQ